MLKDYRSSLEKLAATTPKKKVALIRSLLPNIEAALHSGQTLKDIWVALENNGLGMAYRVFQMTVWRARKNKKVTAPRSWKKVNGSSQQEQQEQLPQRDVRQRRPRSPGKSETVGRKPARFSLARNEQPENGDEQKGGSK